MGSDHFESLRSHFNVLLLRDGSIGNSVMVEEIPHDFADHPVRFGSDGNLLLYPLSLLWNLHVR